MIVFCQQCQQERELASVQLFACPECGAPTMDVRHGEELEVFALEIQRDNGQEAEVRE